MHVGNVFYFPYEMHWYQCKAFTCDIDCTHVTSLAYLLLLLFYTHTHEVAPKVPCLRYLDALDSQSSPISNDLAIAILRFLRPLPHRSFIAFLVHLQSAKIRLT